MGDASRSCEPAARDVFCHGEQLQARSPQRRVDPDLRITASSAGSKLEMTLEAEPQTLLAKGMGVVFRGMIKSCMKEMDKDLDDLKAAAEGKAEAAAATG